MNKRYTRINFTATSDPSVVKSSIEFSTTTTFELTRWEKVKRFFLRLFTKRKLKKEVEQMLNAFAIQRFVTRKRSETKTEECPVYDSYHGCYAESDEQLRQRVFSLQKEKK